jgi:hypothetical protein
VDSVADPDPGSGAFLTPGSRIGKKSGSGSGMNNRDHNSESLKTIFWVSTLKFFDVDPGSGMEKIRIRDGKKSDPRSGTNIPGPQHWQWDTLPDVFRILNLDSFIALGPVTGIGSDSLETRTRMVAQFF